VSFVRQPDPPTSRPLSAPRSTGSGETFLEVGCVAASPRHLSGAVAAGNLLGDGRRRKHCSERRAADRRAARPKGAPPNVRAAKGVSRKHRSTPAAGSLRTPDYYSRILLNSTLAALGAKVSGSDTVFHACRRRPQSDTSISLFLVVWLCRI